MTARQRERGRSIRPGSLPWLSHWALTACLIGLSLGARSAAPDSHVDTHLGSIAPLTVGDEPVIVSEHTIPTEKGPLTYQARIGRLPIRSAETGEVRGRIFFVAYVMTPKRGATPRPLTFLWNGGPGSASSILHMQGLGPRRIDKDHMVDNPGTLLATSDLVFMDAMETGFSRPEKPEFASEFFTLRGDVAATGEFIRAYRTRFRQVDQPVFIAGESYGVFRAAALADFMTDRGDRLNGAILISGDFPNVRQPVAFYDAMHVPARVAVAFHWKKLPPEWMQDYAATMRAANDWVDNTYLPALQCLDCQSPESREKIAAELARWIGMRPDQVDRKTLVVHANHFLEDFFDGDKTRRLDEEDARALQDEISWLGPASVIDSYLRSELGYATDLTYSNYETGYTASPGPKFRNVGSQFSYDIGMPAADDKLGEQYGEVTYVARDNPSWMQNALTRDKKLKVFVATGRYDPLNMCEGDVKVTAQLPAGLSSRIQNQCYEGGHIMYMDAQVRPKFLADFSRFIRNTVAGGS
jgi:carboxypeptidase C (cathepsin A)